MFPVHDWQFWIAMLLVLLAAAYLVGTIIAAGKGGPCHCGRSLDTDPSEPRSVSLTINADCCSARRSS